MSSLLIGVKTDWRKAKWQSEGRSPENQSAVRLVASIVLESLGRRVLDQTASLEDNTQHIQDAMERLFGITHFSPLTH